jgi:lysophospholipase L1-like esterase
MKPIFISLLVLFSVASMAQTTGGVFNASKAQAFNKSATSNGGHPLDYKAMYHDTIHFVDRPFTSVAEANSFLPSVQRVIGLQVVINTGGSVNGTTGLLTGGTNDWYYYKDGIADGNLVLLPGKLQTILNNGDSITAATQNIHFATGSNIIWSLPNNFDIRYTNRTKIFSDAGQAQALFAPSYIWLSGGDSVSVINPTGLFSVKSPTALYGSLKLTGLGAPTSDSVVYKPVGINTSTGAVVQMDRWFGGGGGSSGSPVARVGTVFTDDFARSSIGANYTSSLATANVTFPGSAYLHITGGNATANNYINRAAVTGRNRYIDSIGFLAADSTAGSGFYFGINSTSTFLQIPLYAKVDLGTTTRRGRLILSSSPILTSATGDLDSASAIRISISDSMTLVWVRMDNQFIVTLKNKTTGAGAQINYVFSFGNALTNVGHAQFGTLGGQQNVYSLKSHTDERPGTTLFAGNSIITGVTANDLYSRSEGIMFPDRDQYEVAGGPGATSADLYAIKDEIIATLPRIILLKIGTNDAALSVTGSTFSANVTAFISALQTAGITVVIESTDPRNTVSVVPYNDTLRAIAGRLSCKFIDTYAELHVTAGTGWNPEYLFDGIHPNQAGYYLEAAMRMWKAPELLTPASANNTKLYTNVSASQSADALFVEKDGTVSKAPPRNNLATWGGNNPFTGRNLFNGIFNATKNNQTDVAVQIHPTFNNNGFSQVGVSLDVTGNVNMGSYVGIGGTYTSFPLTVYGDAKITGTGRFGPNIQIDGNTNNEIAGPQSRIQLYGPLGGFLFQTDQTYPEYGRYRWFVSYTKEFANFYTNGKVYFGPSPINPGGDNSALDSGQVKIKADPTVTNYALNLQGKLKFTTRPDSVGTIVGGIPFIHPVTGDLMLGPSNIGLDSVRVRQIIADSMTALRATLSYSLSRDFSTTTNSTVNVDTIFTNPGNFSHFTVTIYLNSVRTDADGGYGGRRTYLIYNNGAGATVTTISGDTFDTYVTGLSAITISTSVSGDNVIIQVAGEPAKNIQHNYAREIKGKISYAP